MTVLAAILIAVTALLHVWFLALEMFLWQRPLGMRTFRLTPEVARTTATLAANQGLYNGFLAAGLIWSLLAAEPPGFQLRVFFLACVIVAAIYGAATVQRGILFVQGLPAALALAAVLLSRV